MIDVFLNVILPVFLVAAIAAAFQRWRGVPVGPLSQVTLYILTPALIFTSLLQQQMPSSVSVKVVGAMLLATAFVLATSIVASKFLRHDRPMQSAFMLSTGFPNAGNMGLPVLLLAFGEPGLAMGVIVFLTQSIAGQSLGIFVAARSRMNGLAPLKQVFKMPAVYAIAAALAVKLAGVELPFVVFQPIKLLSQASIPVMLVVLGLQLGAGIKLDGLPSLGAALAIRLLVAAPLAYLATVIFGLTDLSKSAVIVIAAMPAAVYTTILSSEFQAGPRFVSNAVIASTCASVLTLTVIIWLVKNMLAG